MNFKSVSVKEQSQPVAVYALSSPHFLILSTATPSPDNEAFNEGIPADKVHLVLVMDIHL